MFSSPLAAAYRRKAPAGQHHRERRTRRRLHQESIRPRQNGSRQSLFRLPLKGPLLPRLVLTEAAIDALSLAAIENLRGGTLDAATGGGMGPGTIAAIEALLVDIAMLPDALFCSATGSGANSR